MAAALPRVLFLIDCLNRSGGAERFALALATHLPRDRFEPWMCATRGADEGPVRELREAGVTYVDLGRRSNWDVHRLDGLIRLLRSERFDVLHSHMFGSNVWGSVLGRACGVPVVIAHEHTWSYLGNAFRAWVDGRVIGTLSTRFLAVSSADAERMVAYERVPAEKVTVMPTAYIPSQGRATTDLRNELGLPDDAPLIATAVALRAQKAIEVLLEAHRLVLRSVPSAHLVIAGDGARRRALELHARRLKLERQVHFLGYRDDVDAILRTADVAALSSDFEGMPLFAFECMAAGTPLVATAVGGLRTVVASGRSGILVPPRDPPALAHALISVLTDPVLSARLATEAAEGLAPYMIDPVARQFADLYEQLLQERAHG